jgi:phosphatidylglycerol:prolipoprotein diacylglycerol transferase
MGILALGLWHLRDRVRPGVIFALYLILGGLERFLVEFIRRNSDSFAGLTAAQLWSVAMIVGGLAWLAVVARRSGLGAGRQPAMA